MSDTPPAAKRARSDDGALTVAECSKKVKCLSNENARALLAGLMASLPVARAVIEAEIAKAKPVDLRVYSNKASDIVDLEFDARRGDMRQTLSELMGECKEDLSSTQAFEAIVAILDVADPECDKHVRMQLFGDPLDTIDSEIAKELQGLASDMSSEEKKSISGVVDGLEQTMKALLPYGCGDELEDVVAQMRGDKKAGVEEVSRD